MAELPAKSKYYQPWYDLSLRNLPLPGIVSIFHRISGILLFGLLFWMLWLLDRSLASPEGFAQARGVVSHWFAKLVLLAIAWAYLHHFCAGIRYLFLDMHKGIELASARATSVWVFAISLALTLVVAWRFIW